MGWNPVEQMLWGVAAGVAATLLAVSSAFLRRGLGSEGDHGFATMAVVLFATSAWLITGVARQLWRHSQALEGIPGPRYSFFSGVLWVLQGRDFHRWLGAWAEEYGPVAKYRIMCLHTIIITDPVLAMHVLHSPLFDKPPFVYSLLDALLNGSSILTGPTNEHWKAVRKGVAPAFSTQHMRGALWLVVERTNQLGDYLKSRGPLAELNMDNLLLRESMDVIGQFGFQKETGALCGLTDPAAKPGESDVDVLLGATHEVEKRIIGPKRNLRFWDPDLWRGAALLRRYNKQVKGLLAHIKQKKDVLSQGSFAQLLLKTKDCKSGQPLSDAKLIPEIAALFFAGLDTTGHTNTWLLYSLTQHPEVEARVVEELDAKELLVTPERPHPRAVTYDDLKQLTYLQCVVKEVLRMYPPVGIGQTRMNSKDVTLGKKLFIPKGMLVVVPHYGMHNTSHNWDNPNKFDPERWMRPGEEYAQRLPLAEEWYEGLDLSSFNGKGHNAKAENGFVGNTVDCRRPKRYFPFAEGPRDCVGQSLAKVSLVATTATLLQRFTFRLADSMGGPEGVRAREQYTLVTGIADGMWMHAVPRPGAA